MGGRERPGPTPPVLCVRIAISPAREPLGQALGSSGSCSSTPHLLFPPLCICLSPSISPSPFNLYTLNLRFNFHPFETLPVSLSFSLSLSIRQLHLSQPLPIHHLSLCRLLHVSASLSCCFCSHLHLSLQPHTLSLTHTRNLINICSQSTSDYASLSYLFLHP